MQRCLAFAEQERSKKPLKTVSRPIRLGPAMGEMEELTDQNTKIIPLEKKESKEQKYVHFP